MQVTRNKVAIINYELKDDHGRVLDKSEDGNFAYIHGTSSIIPGLEKAMEGKQAGDDLDVSITPAEAYGERDLANIQRVQRKLFPADIDLQPGMQFQTQTPEGHPVFITVTAVEGDEVIVDGNHPLSGKTLNFSIKVIDVRDATEEELAHGHIHGPGAHEH